MSDYWFARYSVGPNRGRGVVPLNWKGRAVIAGFVLGMIGGAVIWLLLALFTGLFALGIAIFALCAIVGGGTFIWAATTKSDPVRTVADYRGGRA